MTGEAAVVEAVDRYFRSHGFAVLREVPLLGARADVLAVDLSTSEAVAVECKVGDWTRALKQARRYQGATRHAYVALLRQPSPRFIAAAREQGVGVLEVRAGSVLEHSPPCVAPHYVPEIARRFLLGLGELDAGYAIT